VAGGPLITGATGFAGGHLLERIVSRGGPVTAWSHKGSARRNAARPHDPQVTWNAVSMLDRAEVHAALDSANPSVIYHCAGQADVQSAWRAPAAALRSNVLGTHYLLESARELGLDCRVLVTGSALLYKPQAGAITEDSPVGAANPYGVSKLAQEMIAADSPLPVLLARPFNHAGPRQQPSYATSAFARQIVEVEAGRREPILKVGNLDAQRDITDVRDTVRAYEALVDRGQPGRPYNICSGRTHSMRSLLDILLSLARVRVEIAIDPALLRPSDNPIILGSHERLTRDTGWTPGIPIEQTLSDLLEYWRSQPAS